MNNYLFHTLIFLLPLYIFGQLEGHEETYKRLIQKGVLDKSKVEYYDSANNNYSNFYYGFAYKKPKNWKYDNGVGMATVFRTYNYDSILTLSVSVFKNNGKDIELTSHDYFDSIGEDELIKKMIAQVKSIGQNMTNMTIKKTFYKNIPATYSVSESIEKEDDLEVVFKNLSYQFFRKQMTFTIGLIVPDFFYKIKPKYYNSLLKNFSIIQTLGSNEFIDEKKFIINNIDIREVDTYRLKNMIEVFFEDCKINNIYKKLPDKVYATFEPLDSPLLGISYGKDRDDIVFLKIDPERWSKASITQKWYLIYHELGHDVLNFEHGEGGKMMFNFIDRNYTWEEFFKDKKNMFTYFKEN